jgi:hypothetical protein
MRMVTDRNTNLFAIRLVSGVQTLACLENPTLQGTVRGLTPYGSPPARLRRLLAQPI